MAGLLFNGTGYVSFPKDNRLILNHTDGWTLLIKMKYGTNTGNKLEPVFVGQQAGDLLNYLETFVGQDTAPNSWERNRFVCQLRTNGGGSETIESPNLTFPDADYAAYFVRKQGNTLAVGRCSAGGSVQKTTKTNSQLFNLNLQEFFLGYAGNRATASHIILGNGREVKEFGLVSRSMSDADIQSYANGTSFATIAGANLFGFAPMDEGAGTTVDFDVDVTPVVGTISGGLTWIGAAGATFTSTISAGIPTPTASGNVNFPVAGTVTANITAGIPVPAASGSVNFVAAGSDPIFTSEPLYDNTGTLLANTLLDYVALYSNTSPRVLILEATNITTNASGVFTVQDAALTTAVTYKADWQVNSTGVSRMPAKAAV